MPIYEYECPACGEKFEMFRSISQCEEGADCPKCGAAKAVRIMSNISGGSGECDSCSTSSCGPT